MFVTTVLLLFFAPHQFVLGAIAENSATPNPMLLPLNKMEVGDIITDSSVSQLVCSVNRKNNDGVSHLPS